MATKNRRWKSYYKLGRCRLGISMIEIVTTAFDDGDPDEFESPPTQTSYSLIGAERNKHIRFRVLNERHHEAGEGFPRFATTFILEGVPGRIELFEYEVNLDACLQLIAASSPSAFSHPLETPTAPAERPEGDA